MAGLQDTRLGAYELLECIGEGGMADVYRAKQLSAFGREVAVKVIRGEFTGDEPFRRRFLREAHAVSRLSHPNILPLIEFGDEKGLLYLVMPLVREGTLRDLLAITRGRYRWRKRCRFLCRFAMRCSMPTRKILFTAILSRKMSCCSATPMSCWLILASPVTASIPHDHDWHLASAAWNIWRRNRQKARRMLVPTFIAWALSSIKCSPASCLILARCPLRSWSRRQPIRARPAQFQPAPACGDSRHSADGACQRPQPALSKRRSAGGGHSAGAITRRVSFTSRSDDLAGLDRSAGPAGERLCDDDASAAPATRLRSSRPGAARASAPFLPCQRQRLRNRPCARPARPPGARGTTSGRTTLAMRPRRAAANMCWSLPRWWLRCCWRWASPRWLRDISGWTGCVLARLILARSS